MVAVETQKTHNTADCDTIQFWAPEMFDLGANDVHGSQAGDMWAFGLILLQLLTGQEWISGLNAVEIASRMKQFDVRAACRKEMIPNIIQPLLCSLLSKNPQERLSSAELIMTGRLSSIVGETNKEMQTNSAQLNNPPGFDVEKYKEMADEDKKQYLGEFLYDRVVQMDAERAGEITNFILELGLEQSLALLRDDFDLARKVREAQSHLVGVTRIPQVRTNLRQLCQPQSRQVPTPQHRHRNHPPGFDMEEYRGMADEDKKQYLGEFLYQKVIWMDSERAGQITGMILELGPRESLALLQDDIRLVQKVREAQIVIDGSNGSTQLPIGGSLFNLPPGFDMEEYRGMADEDKKQYLGEFLYQKVIWMDSERAGQITGMILELGLLKAFVLIQDDSRLAQIVREAQEFL
ncbi:hypothetical protein BLNAU_9772 [Blattamonas nauphoetae]|uniref:Protein kinase domain-containing protein n=1 Tax=Blattamonas nauphoetae TaxID=2049346 RepID=A0ABQ9XUS4_9EUKA|nr:hypothetical protein BLNAU_9772 [Blattamonas nauphoetae]